MNPQSEAFLRDAVELLRALQAANEARIARFELRASQAEGHTMALEIALRAIIRTHPDLDSFAGQWPLELLALADTVVDHARTSAGDESRIQAMNEALARITRAIEHERRRDARE